MRIEGVSAEALARTYGTPLYVYSKRTILSRFETLKRAFRRFDPLLCYALKANSNRAVVSLLARAGAGADVVSGGELRRALDAGVPAGRIVFSGVGKTEAEIEAALKAGVLAFNVESADELDLLQRVARRLDRRAPVSVRLNPDVDAGTHPHITTGLAANKFGVRASHALRLYDRAGRSAWLKVVGIQCHIGSQINSVRPYEKAARAVLKLVGRLPPLRYIDLGGGFGVSYRGEPELPLERLARALERILPRGPRLLLEPGRRLTADAGTLLTRVLAVKDAGRRRFVIVDAGMNDLARPALYGAYHPVTPAAAARKGRKAACDVVGPVCETADHLARGRRLPPLRRGDLLAVGKAGAYGFSMSSQYNSRPRPAEVLVDGTRARLIRRRETYEDLVRHER